MWQLKWLEILPLTSAVTYQNTEAVFWFQFLCLRGSPSSLGWVSWRPTSPPQHPLSLMRKLGVQSLLCAGHIPTDPAQKGWDVAMMQTNGKENMKVSQPCGRAFCLGLCNEIRRGDHSCSCRAVGDAQRGGENWHADLAQVAAAMGCHMISLAEMKKTKDARQATDPDPVV